MRWDIKVSAHFWVAAAFLAVCVMAAPLAFHLEGLVSVVCFWISLGGAVVFAVAGFHAALRGEQSFPQKGHVRRMIGLYGMVLCGLGFIGFAGAYFWPTSPSPKDSAAQAPSQTEPHPLVFQAQFAEIKSLEEFFGGKDESKLREMFDITPMIRKNIGILNIKIGFVHAGKWQDFNYGPYHEGHGDATVSLKRVRHSVGPSGLHIDAKPNDVFYLVQTTKFQDTKRKLTAFVNSGLLPDSIKKEVITFDGIIDSDVELIILVFDEKMHESEKYFLQHSNMNTPYYGVIESDYAVRFSPLKPAADHILQAIRAHWQLNQ